MCVWVIKHGDPARTDRLVCFTCPECGCEYVCGPQDIYVGKERPMAYCPDCGRLCEYGEGRLKL